MQSVIRGTCSRYAEATSMRRTSLADENLARSSRSVTTHTRIEQPCRRALPLVQPQAQQARVRVRRPPLPPPPRSGRGTPRPTVARTGRTRKRAPYGKNHQSSNPESNSKWKTPRGKSTRPEAASTGSTTSRKRRLGPCQRRSAVSPLYCFPSASLGD